jgi:hypothetical protein
MLFTDRRLTCIYTMFSSQGLGLPVGEIRHRSRWECEFSARLLNSTQITQYFFVAELKFLYVLMCRFPNQAKAPRAATARTRTCRRTMSRGCACSRSSTVTPSPSPLTPPSTLWRKNQCLLVSSYSYPAFQRCSILCILFSRSAPSLSGRATTLLVCWDLRRWHCLSWC